MRHHVLKSKCWKSKAPDQSLFTFLGHKIKNNTLLHTALKAVSILESLWFFKLILNYL